MSPVAPTIDKDTVGARPLTPEGEQYPLSKAADVDGGSAWDPKVAEHLGYSESAQPGARFSWWIPLFSGLLALGSYIAWVILIFRAQDYTQAAMDGFGVYTHWWDVARALLLATAIMYPIILTGALGVAAWRWYLARRLNLQQPDPKWMKSSRAFQGANATTNALLWFMTAWLVVGASTMWVWAAAGAGITWGGNTALIYVDPVWNGVTRILNGTNNLADTLNELRNELPAVGRRRRALLGQALGAAAAAGGLHPRAAALAAALGGGGGEGAGGGAAAAAEAEAAAAAWDPTAVGGRGGGSAAAASRQLQQLPPLGNVIQGIGNVVQSVAGVTDTASGILPTITNATRTVVGIASPLLSALPQVLPNGSANPLFNAIEGVVGQVRGKVSEINGGCPTLSCINVADKGVWLRGDPCICDLSRVRAGVGPASQIYGAVSIAFAMFILMYCASTFLLMHMSATWARTRTEAKLLTRLPPAGAAAAAAGGEGGGAKAAAAGTAALAV